MLFQPETELQTIAFVTFEGSQAIHPLELQRVSTQRRWARPTPSRA